MDAPCPSLEWGTSPLDKPETAIVTIFYLLPPTGSMNMTYNPYLFNLQCTTDDLYIL